MQATHRGFTLLEMLVVMVIMGMITSLALPAMQRWHDASQLRAQAAMVVDGMRAAAMQASANRQSILVDESSFIRASTTRPARAASAAVAAAHAAANTPADTPADTQPETPKRLVVELPTGWSVASVAGAMFLANGLCKPGTVSLLTERGEPVSIAVRGPVCVVERSTADAGTRP